MPKKTQINEYSDMGGIRGFLVASAIMDYKE